MLYTSSRTIFKKIERNMKPYYLIKNHGNTAVLPDESDLTQVRNSEITWEGFKVNYLAKLMRSDAEEWMKRVSSEAVSEDVVLVSDEEGVERLYRVLLAEMMISMFSGRLGVRFMGELKV